MNWNVRFLLALLAAFHVAVLFCGFVAPYAPDRQQRDFPYAPPTRPRFIDAEGKFHLRPFVYRLQLREDGTYAEDHSTMWPLQLLVSGDPYYFAGLWLCRLHLFGVQAPGSVFLMGTDDYGRDQLSRFICGARVSLMAGLAAAFLALLLGAILGGISGYYGKVLDDVIMAAAEMFLALPWFYLLLGVRAVLPLDLEPSHAFLLVVIILGAIGWARPARLMRGVVLSAKVREFVIAAHGFGASDLYILRRHVLPQASGVLLTQASLLVPQYILAEVTMSFLGLGVNEPGVSWGLMLASLQQYHALVSYWWMWIPAFLLIPIFLAYYGLSAALGGLDAPQWQTKATVYKP